MVNADPQDNKRNMLVTIHSPEGKPTMDQILQIFEGYDVEIPPAQPVRRLSSRENDYMITCRLSDETRAAFADRDDITFTGQPVLSTPRVPFS